MCGICGISYNNPSDKVDKAMISLMMESIKHRGPDDDGLFVKDGIWLGFTRLSIIDLENGSQPCTNENNDIFVICNGEIYNYKELRKLLIGRGHNLKSNSDVEVIVHLYEEYKEKMLTLLRGMFAIALWDEKRKKLIIARDRLGIKQVYYYYDEERKRLIFSSEIKAIYKASEIIRKINIHGLYNLFFNGFIFQPKTLFDNIHCLESGCYLECTEKGISKHSYWDLSENLNPASSDEKKIVDDFFEIFSTSVGYKFISDVPVHFMLSGGVDSSAIVSVASKKFGRKVNTHSMSFQEEYLDESKYSSMVAEDVNSHHKIISIDGQLLDYLPEALYYLEVPHFSPNFLSHFYLSKKVKGITKVLVSGEGADEVLGGYYEFKNDKRVQALLELSREDRLKEFGKIQNLIEGRRGTDISYLLNNENMKDSRLRYLFWRNVASDIDITSIFSKDILENESFGVENLLDEIKLPNKIMELDYLKQHLYMDMKLRMQSLMVLQLDKLYMANGIEVRVPFLDHKLVEFCYNINSDNLLKEYNEKYILRSAMRNILPEEIRNRKKQGLRSPLREWFSLPLPEYAKEMLSNSELGSKGYFKPRFVERMLSMHQSGRADFGNILFLVLCTQIVDEIFVKQRSL